MPPFNINNDQVQGGTPLKDLVTIDIYSIKSRPQLLGIDCMVEAMPPVLLCGLFKVHSKHSVRAVTLIQQLCYNKKLSKLVY